VCLDPLPPIIQEATELSPFAVYSIIEALYSMGELDGVYKVFQDVKERVSRWGPMPECCQVCTAWRRSSSQLPQGLACAYAALIKQVPWPAALYLHDEAAMCGLLEEETGSICLATMRVVADSGQLEVCVCVCAFVRACVRARVQLDMSNSDILCGLGSRVATSPRL
jgi:hypothetical protein